MAEGVRIIWTPWRGHGELLQNRTWLFSRSCAHNNGPAGSDKRRKACDQISAWKLRGNLPHAVESSWQLTEAVLIDEAPSERMPAFAVKAAYVTAISRFVTGLLDSQQESKYKVSMYAKAQQIGLPALFVDLRHESTHGDVPSLTNLRSAAQRALQWLWDDYWSKLGEKAIPETPTEWVDDGVSRRHRSVGDYPDRMDGEAEENSKAQENGSPDSIAGLGGWGKWQGHWIAKPIGTIDN